MKKDIKYFTVNKELIFDFMKEKGLSIKEFCLLCGIGRSTYENVLKGKGNISALAYCKVAKVLKVNVCELVGNEVAKH